MGGKGRKRGAEPRPGPPRGERCAASRIARGNGSTRRWGATAALCLKSRFSPKTGEIKSSVHPVFSKTRRRDLSTLFLFYFSVLAMARTAYYPEAREERTVLSVRNSTASFLRALLLQRAEERALISVPILMLFIGISFPSLKRVSRFPESFQANKSQYIHLLLKV